MTGTRTGPILALIAVLCVLGIFFFPAPVGPYSAIHGPVTALQGTRAAIKIHSAIAQPALDLDSLLPAPVEPHDRDMHSSAVISRGLEARDTILRC